MHWFEQNLHILYGFAGFAATVMLMDYFRRHPESSAARMIFWLFPLADPTDRAQTGIRPHAVIVWCIAIIILLLIQK
ncbi:MAG TPA: hypothetical protein PLF22_09775 [Pseudomonadales bacterium]|nr:hypothetical protein [Pseudomonadales bacterium]